jgi:acyl-CoA thioesterase
MNVRTGHNSTQKGWAIDYYSSVVIIQNNKPSETPEKDSYTHFRVKTVRQGTQRRHIVNMILNMFSDMFMFDLKVKFTDAISLNSRL